MPPRTHDDPTAVKALRRSVVKVLSTSDPPDYDQPWQTRGVENATGSGAIIDTAAGPRVLTNAHVVENAVFIEVRRYGRAQKYVAEVEGIGFECDLALLKVEKKDFFQGTIPFPIGTLPSLGDHVSVLGFPIGGDRISVTEGVVSRIEVTPYAQSERQLLSVQIDAAINEGNSGGPVVKDARMVGVAFQALEEAENIGYLIPAPIVEHFLRDIEDGTFAGFPALGIVTQRLESDVHRRFLGLPKGKSGVLVTRVEYGGAAWGVLQPGDVLLALGKSPLAGDGTVRFRGGARIEFDQLVAGYHVGEKMPLSVWRDGARLDAEVELAALPCLIPRTLYAARPTYYLYAGLLFVPVTRGYLRTWGEDWMTEAPQDLVSLYQSGVRTRRMQEVVVLQKVLADQVNRGYHEIENVRIVKCQERRIRGLRDLVREVERTEDEFLRFETADGRSMVFDRALAAERHEGILKRYGVPRDRSDDLDGAAAGA
jgi:S1-C subfamily serine protease